MRVRNYMTVGGILVAQTEHACFKSLLLRLKTNDLSGSESSNELAAMSDKVAGFVNQIQILEHQIRTRNERLVDVVPIPVPTQIERVQLGHYARLRIIGDEGEKEISLIVGGKNEPTVYTFNGKPVETHFHGAPLCASLIGAEVGDPLEWRVRDRVTTGKLLEIGIPELDHSLIEQIIGNSSKPHSEESLRAA